MVLKYLLRPRCLPKCLWSEVMINYDSTQNLKVRWAILRKLLMWTLQNSHLTNRVYSPMILKYLLRPRCLPKCLWSEVMVNYDSTENLKVRWAILRKFFVNIASLFSIYNHLYNIGCRCEHKALITTYKLNLVFLYYSSAVTQKFKFAFSGKLKALSS